MTAGCGTSNNASNITASPTFSPAGGTFNTSQAVTIVDTTKGAVMYCTTDGTTPTTSSPQCAQPTTVFKSEYLQAIALAPGMSQSAVVSAGFTIDLSAAATPTFSPAGGTYTTRQTVSIADATAGANIFYTTDGSVPTASSTVYTGSITVSKTETISAIATASGFANSGVASAAFNIFPVAATPVFSVGAGTYTTAQTVTITDATTGAAIYYTLDGTPPSASSTRYTGPITISASSILNAIAVASGYTNSAAQTANYTITPTAATPTFSVAGGTYTSVQSVAISDATQGASIFYTLDGSTPATSVGGSTLLYNGAISVAQSEIITAIATAPGTTPSAVATANYVIHLPTVASLSFSPGAGTYSTAQSVTISDATPNAVIYYTVDGSNPATSLTGSTMLYSGAIPVSQSETIKAIATAPGFANTSVQSAAYVINLSGAATPTFSLANGTYTGTQNVTIADTTPGAAIFYTLDGSTPATSVTGSTLLYAGAIVVSQTETIKAIATAPNFNPSGVATVAYTIQANNASLAGKVLSGTAPVKGAQVQLYVAGQTGYGSAATALLSTPVVTDSTGAFTFPFLCAASPGALVYVVASGGDAGAGANASLELMAALGPCSMLKPSIVVNEVTTVASAYALSAFITTVPDVGSSSTNYRGLSNAFAAVNNLVDITTGDALSITPAYATNPVPFLNSSTVPQSRIDTLANILNGCVDSNGATCANLFSLATPAAGTAPANTLQAEVNIAQNPGAGVSGLFALASPTGPFQPVLAAAPGDWTLALTYTGGGLGIPPNTTATYAATTAYPTVAAGAAAFPTSSSGLAIDATGNVWVAASVETAGSSATASMLAEFSNLGAPLTPSTTINGSSITLGGYDPEPTSDGARGLLDIALDQSGTVWMDDYVTNLLQVTSVFSAPGIPTKNSNSNTGAGAAATAIDGAGNIWTGRSGTDVGSSVLSEFQKTDTGVTAIVNGVNGSAGATNSTYPGFGTMVFDANSVLWDGVKSGAANGGADVFQTDSQGGIAYDAFPPPAVGNDSNSNNAVTLVADGNRNVYGCADGDPNLANLNVFNATAEGSSVPSIAISTGRGCGIQLLLDGQNHLFAVQNEFVRGSGVVLGIDEFTTTGTLLSPASGYTGTSTGEPVTLNQQNDFSTNFVPAAAIDESGNLWVLNGETNGFDSNFNLVPGNVLVEYIGLAAPVATPLAKAVTNSVNAAPGGLGARP